MVRRGLGRLYGHAKGRVVAYLPAGVVGDTSFPFRVGDPVWVRIDGDRVVLEPVAGSPVEPRPGARGRV